jgi:hypothetical protein
LPPGPAATAEIARVEKAPIIDPFSLVDEKAVHQRDLIGRTAKRDEADPGPKGEGFGEAWLGEASGPLMAGVRLKAPG